MPSGWWHHIEYRSAGIGFSIRSLSPKISGRLRGFYQIGVLTHVDELMRVLLKDKWFETKKKIAHKRASEAMAAIS